MSFISPGLMPIMWPGVFPASLLNFDGLPMRQLKSVLSFADVFSVGLVISGPATVLSLPCKSPRGLFLGLSLSQGLRKEGSWWLHVAHMSCMHRYKALPEGLPAPLKEKKDPLLVSEGWQGPRVIVTQ